MIGLALMAQELAMRRALVGAYPLGFGWCIGSRRLAKQFPNGPSSHYYRIIDRISKGETP